MNMIGTVLALLTAVVWGVTLVLIRKRLDESNFVSVTLVLTLIGNIILWPLALLFTDLRAVNFWGVLFFVTAGLLAPGIGRLLYFKGMESVGVSVNASIFATYPMYSSMLAVLLLGEALTPENWIGISFIVVGVVFVERSISNPKTGPKRILKKGVIFSLLATSARALSIIISKLGLNIYNKPLLGVAIGFTSSFFLYLLLSIPSHTMRSSLFSRRAFRLFWKAGVCASLGWVLGFCALSYERVSIVTALIQIQPLFVLLFAYLYLRELEHLSFKLVVSTLLIVIGVMLVSTS